MSNGHCPLKVNCHIISNWKKLLFFSVSDLVIVTLYAKKVNFYQQQKNELRFCTLKKSKGK